MQTDNNLPTDPNETPQDPAPADAPTDPPADPPSSEDPPADPPSGDDPPSEDGGDSEPESRFTRDIRRLKAQNREAQAREQAIREYAEYWRTKALGGETGKEDAEPSEDKGAPKLADFDGDTDKWAEAYAKHVQTVAERAAESRLSKAKESDSQTQVRNQWNERLTKFAEQHEDAIEVIGDSTFTQTETMSKVIMASEKGPEIAYHLSQNRAENERIKRLSPEMQAAELGRLEAKLGAPPVPANGGTPPKSSGKKPSNAPPPPKPVSGSGAPSVDLEKCSLDQFLEARLGRKQA